MDAPHFNITANVNISAYLQWIKANDQQFTPAIIFALAQTANDIPEFRWRIREGQVVEHEQVHPSFTVTTEQSDVFSFCTVDYAPDYATFVKRTQQVMSKMKTNPSFEDEEGRDDYLFISAIPWVSFTGFMHPMHYSPVDSVPRFAYGKYFKQGDQIMMPLSVQAHHAVVDGHHMGQFFVRIQQFFDRH